MYLTCHISKSQTFSHIFKLSRPNVGGYWLSLLKISEASSHTSQVCQAVFFHLPRKNETIAQPVNAWKTRSPLLFSSAISIEIVFRNPPQIPSLAKGNSQLLKTNLLKGRQNANCYGKNIDLCRWLLPRRLCCLLQLHVLQLHESLCRLLRVYKKPPQAGWWNWHWQRLLLWSQWPL